MAHLSYRPFKRPKFRYKQLELPFDDFDIVLHQMDVIWAAIVELDGVIEIQGLYSLYDHLTLKLVKMKYNMQDHLCNISSDSQTIPTNVMTPREIIKRYAQGAEVPAAFYESDDDPDHLDDDAKMERDIPEDDFEYRQFILDESEIGEAAPAIASTNSDSGGNNTGDNQDNSPENSQPSDNHQNTNLLQEQKSDDINQ